MTNTNSTPLIFNMVLDPVTGKKVVCMPYDDLVGMVEDSFYSGFWHAQMDKSYPYAKQKWGQFQKENETFKQLSQLNKQP